MRRSEKTTTLGTRLRVRLEVYVDVPNRDACEAFGISDAAWEVGGALEAVDEREWTEHVKGDLSMLWDAIHAQLDEGADIIDEVDPFDYDVQFHPFAKPELVRPDFDKGEFYSQPTPNFVSGLVKFGPNGIEHVESSQFSRLTDDQLQGAMFSLERAWKSRGMDLYQKQQLIELFSEVHWTMMSRPTQHAYIPTVEDDPTTPCRSCRNAAELHPTFETPDPAPSDEEE